MLALAIAIFSASSAYAAPAPTPADAYVLGNVEQVAAILRSEKYPVEIKADSEGLPYIQTNREERPFRIYFYDCDDGVRLGRCLSAQFYAAFSLGRPFPPERMNDWNRTHRFARGYIDREQDPALEMDVNLAADGMPPRLFKDTFDLWLELFVVFDEFVFDTPAPGKEAAATAKPG